MTSDMREEGESLGGGGGKCRKREGEVMGTRESRLVCRYSALRMGVMPFVLGDVRPVLV